jgi:single-stranded-DNA-specific exonuclease
MLAPRLNASGRVDSAHASLDLLLSGDLKEADRLAGFLNDHNRTRQKIEERVLNEAVDLIEREIDFRDDFIIVLAKEDWHPGVLGIVAAKIVDRYYRPAVIISLQDGTGRGSARSVHNFHIYEALARCGDLLKEFGGHKYAAGLTVDRKHLKDFKRVLNEVARSAFQDEAFAPTLEADAQIPLSIVTRDLMSDIDRLSPYGEGNKRPIFISRHLAVRSKPALVGRNTLKFWVSDGAGTFGAVGFGLGDHLGMVKEASHVDLAYQLGWDEWSPENPIQLEVKDIKVS